MSLELEMALTDIKAAKDKAKSGSVQHMPFGSVAKSVLDKSGWKIVEVYSIGKIKYAVMVPPKKKGGK